MTWTDLIPNFPQGFDRWESFITVFALFALKTIRPTLLKQRSMYVDRFGWSILAFDYAFAVLTFLSVTFTLYPGLNMTPWIGRVALAAVLVTCLWQVYEVIVAQPIRVEAAVSGVATGKAWDGTDRRDPNRPGRREVDISRYKVTQDVERLKREAQGRTSGST